MADDMALTNKRARELAGAADKASAALVRRNEAIRKAIAEGGTLREVGAAVGMSHQAVADIARKTA